MVPQKERRRVGAAQPNRSRLPLSEETCIAGSGFAGDWRPNGAVPVLLAALLTGSMVGAAQGAAAIEPLTLEVNREGIAVATGVLTLPGSPTLARHLLGDALNWPNLFISHIRVQSVARRGDRTVTDMYLSPPLFLGELHMLVETRESSPHRVETRLVRGDLRRYTHVWQLTPLAGARCTRAVLDLTIQLNTWVPHWLFRWLMRHELDGHLERVVAEAARRAGAGTTCASDKPAERPAG